MKVDIIASDISDNFFYVISDANGRAALVDPVDARQAIAFVDDQGLRVDWVINTHSHPDHIGGNDAVLEHFDAAQLTAGEVDAGRIEAQQSRPVDRRVSDGDIIAVGDVDLRVLDTPGHTPGHISLLGDDRLFSGDTIFVGGAGNCSFGGDPGQLFGTFVDVLSTLPDETVFYPGHDYARRNLGFILSIESANQRAADLLDDADDSDSLMLSSLGQERRYNPFFRADDPDLADRLMAQHPRVYDQQKQRANTRAETVFRTVRQLRNRW